MDEVQLFPVWKQAVKEFLDAGVQDGVVLPISWLEAHFGLPPIDDGERLTGAQFRERQFAWLRNLDEFRRELLEAHHICLVAVHGEGYRVVPPGEQTATAQDRLVKDVRRTFKTAGMRLRHVRLGALTDDQRKENADAIAKIAALRGMQRKALR